MSGYQPAPKTMMMTGSVLLRLLRLAKVPLSFFVALSAQLGFVLYRPVLSTASFVCFFTIFFLATGCAVLNNIQDSRFDLLFSRTRKRPIPAGEISSRSALGIAVFSIVLGFWGFSFLEYGSSLPISAAIAAVFLYNGIYTPLKSRTVLAIIPGAFCGMLAPLIGWFAAGGRGLSPEIVTVMVILGVWQLPHFWLIMLYYARDYRGAQMPSMLSLFSEKQLRKIIFCWVLTFAVLTLLMPFVRIVVSALGQGLLILNAGGLCLFFGYFCFYRASIGERGLRYLFHHLNYALFLIILVGMLDNIAV